MLVQGPRLACDVLTPRRSGESEGLAPDATPAPLLRSDSGPATTKGSLFIRYHVLWIELVGGVRLCDCCPRCAHSSSLCCPSRDFCAIFTVGVSCHSGAPPSASA